MNKLVKLAAPVWLQPLGRSYMPIEGPLIVTPDTAAAWQAEGMLNGEAEDIEAEPSYLDPMLDAPALAPAAAPAVKTRTA